MADASGARSGAVPRPSGAAEQVRNARLYMVGLAVSLVGDNALSLVAGIWVKDLTGSSSLAGVTSVCIYAPSLLAPAAGLLADRMPRKQLLLLINTCAAVAVVSLVGVTGRGDIWLIYLVMAIYGSALVLIDPAESALFVELFSDDLRRRMNGWRLALQETGRLIAPLLGAGLFVALGGRSVALLDAASFLVAAWAVAQLRLAPTTSPPPRKSWWREVTAGARHIRATPRLSRLVVAGSVIMAISGVGVAAQYSLVAALHREPGFLGVLVAALGAGSVLASVSSGRLLQRVSEEALALAGLINFAVGTLLRTTDSLAAAVVGSVVLGFALPWVFLAVLNAVQALTPNELQGRVSAAVTLVLIGPQAPSQGLGAYAITAVTYRWIYVGSATAAIGLALWLWPRQRTPRQRTPRQRTPPQDAAAVRE